MTEPAVRMVCVACGAEPDPWAGDHPFACPNADSGDGADHLLARRVDPAQLASGWDPEEPERNPFVRFRRWLYSYRLWREAGRGDGGFVALVGELDRAVAAVDGRGFVSTPLTDQPELAGRAGVGGVWIKDETGNVSGSHKARHQQGVLLYLAVAERLGLLPKDAPLAVASCGNAGLAAAVVARAGRRRLAVFVPPSVDPVVRDRLEALGAKLTLCRRQGEAGDPCYLRFREAIAGGALPLSVQGNENGLTIEGGMTLGLELVAGLQARGARVPDRLLVQVGGGALASGCMQAFDEARRAGLIATVPRLHTVQTVSASPLARAYQRLVDGLRAELEPSVRDVDLAARPSDDLARAERAAWQLAAPALAEARARRLNEVVAHRRQVMWAWESEPHSVAHGILDDETYDWQAICAAMLDGAGYPITVAEQVLERANALGRQATGIDVDHTGSAGLAGLVQLAEQVDLAAEEVALLFTGVVRR